MSGFLPTQMVLLLSSMPSIVTSSLDRGVHPPSRARPKKHRANDELSAMKHDTADVSKDDGKYDGADQGPMPNAPSASSRGERDDEHRSDIK